MKKPVKWTIMIAAGTAAVTAIVFAMKPQPIPVDLATVRIDSMRVTVDEEGKTRIRERYVMSSPLTGRLRRITLDPGDRVKAQETVLAVIEPTDPDLLDARALAEAGARVRAAEAAFRQAGATIERARAALDFAENELRRLVEASESDAATRHELDGARTRERTAAEELRAAEFGREIAQYELEVARSALLYAQGETAEDENGRMSLYSPIDGAVLKVMQQSVAVVTPGMPLIEVGDPRDLELVIDVLSSDGVRIAPGQRVIVEHWGGPHPLEAAVRLVEPSAFMHISALGIEEQRVNVIADFVTPPEQRAALGDGFRIEASIVIWEEEDVLQIPGSALFRHNGGWSVFVLRDGRAALRPVEVARRNGLAAQITSGLVEGMRVIVHPRDDVRDGVRIEPRKE